MSPIETRREETVAEILRRRVSAIIRTKDQALARDAMNAAVAGGIRIVEFTLTTPGATQLIAEFAENAEILVGAGTVLTPEMATESARAGARFVVSPVCDDRVILQASEMGLACIPGTMTPTEMQKAHNHGADFVKLFPAPADVKEFISAVLGPLPHLRIFPTAGVTVGNVVEVLESGAAGAGFVRSLFEPQWLTTRDFKSIERRAADICRRVSNG